MSLSNSNASAATDTHLRSDNYSSLSGLCVDCLDGCPGFCEVGKSAYRSTENVYPKPFGDITVGAEKEFPVDFSHFNILGTTVGAKGQEDDSDKAIFPTVDLETTLGRNESLKLNYPWLIGALGSTEIAKKNWEGLAIGGGISGVPITIGENVCAMDPESDIEDGQIVSSPDMERRVKLYRKWQMDGYGGVIVQANVEDSRLGVHRYALEELEVDGAEIKWGQGAKDIGGEVKLDSLSRAKTLKSRGYIVLPDPENPTVQKAFKNGDFDEFERHSRVGMVSKGSFIERVEELRDLGSDYVSLKTGAYRPSDLARAVRYASEAQIDLLTVDGAGGGTGMSPWLMMNEWGIPTVYIESLLHKYLKELDQAGEYVPPVAIAGGFSLEDHIFKGLALGSPYVKAVAQARAPITAAHVGKTVGNMVENGKGNVVKEYGDEIEQVFIEAADLQEKYNSRYPELPPTAMGVYSYYKRLEQGLQQFMAGARKFSLEHIDRDDLVALTREAAEATGIDYVTESDEELAMEIIKGNKE
ncbi:FMN-binding glutamate synthase family protein [Candidatus Bipolaricaulota bacterium]|nr:FMN-binding glutamate synthase family protein [Candidatus Bipolaricaulota bacterium]